MKIKIISSIFCMLLVSTALIVTAHTQTKETELFSSINQDAAFLSLPEENILPGTYGMQADIIGFVRSAEYMNTTNKVTFIIKPICVFTYTHFYNATRGMPWVHFILPFRYDFSAYQTQPLVGFHGTITGDTIKFIKGKIIWAEEIP